MTLSWIMTGYFYFCYKFFTNNPLLSNVRFVLITSFDIYHNSSKWCGNLSLPRRKTEAQRWSVQFSHSVVSDCLRPHGLQHARPPCPSPTPGVQSNSHPSSQWCHPAISSSVIPFSSCLQSSQHQALFKWVSSSHQIARILEYQLQHQSFQWIFRTDFL